MPVGRFRLVLCGQSGDTWRVLVKDIGGARAALRAGRPADLLGLAECGWLDVKAGVYRLDDPAKALELAKDVAAFANTGTGGMILVGYTTRKDYDREILDEVRPVRRALVDLDRYRKLIRERVIPAPEDSASNSCTPTPKPDPGHRRARAAGRAAAVRGARPGRDSRPEPALGRRPDGTVMREGRCSAFGPRLRWSPMFILRWFC
jgi:hypothetical protein